MCRVVVKINKDREKLAQESCNDGSNSGDYDLKSNGEKGDKESGGFEGGDDKEVVVVILMTVEQPREMYSYKSQSVAVQTRLLLKGPL